MSIHASATVSGRAVIADDAEIGPYCVIEGEVEIGPQTVVESGARIGSRYGRVRVGARNHIQHGAVLGGPPQDLGYAGGAYTALEIGDDNRIGEFASINLGIDEYLRTHGFRAITDLIGGVDTRRTANQAASG